MKNVIIDFLSEDDRLKPPYSTGEHFINPLSPFIVRCKSVHEIYEVLEIINSDDEWVIVTFLSHANEEWLGMYDGKKHHALKYPQLLEAVNKCVTNYNVYLNLMANCESFGIAKYLTQQLNIAEVWVTSVKTQTLKMALIAANGESFEYLNNEFMIGDLTDYRRIMIKQLNFD